MTDNNHGHDSDEALHDDAVHAESWQEAPQDDFEDSEAAATVTDGPDAEAAAHGDSANKKRGTMVLFGAMAVGVVVIGGLAYMQFGGSSNSGAPTALPPAIMQSSTPKTAAGIPGGTGAVKPADTGVTPTSGEVDMNAIYNAGQAQPGAVAGNAVAMPSNAGNPVPDMASEKPALQAATEPAANGNIPTPPLTATATPVVPPTVASAQPVAAPVMPSNAPAGTMVAVPSASKAIVVNQGQAVIMPPEHAAVTAVLPAHNQADEQAMAARIDALNKKISDLQDQLEQTTIQTNQLANRVDTTMAKGAASSGHAMVKPSHANPDKAASDDVPAQPDELVASPRKNHASHHHRARHMPVHHHASTAASVKGTAKGSSAWVLRAATPDAAWVAESANAPELRQIKVGDTLPGIGAVKSIRETKAGWLVTGTKGTVH